MSATDTHRAALAEAIWEADPGTFTAPTVAAVLTAVLAVRDREMEQLRTDLAAGDEEIARLTAHTDATCEVVAERDALLAELAAVREGTQQ